MKLELPQHYLSMCRYLAAGYDVPDASLKAFQQVTGRVKRRRMRRGKKS